MVRPSELTMPVVKRAFQAKRISDREHLLADLQSVGIAQVQRGQLGARLNLQ